MVLVVANGLDCGVAEIVAAGAKGLTAATGWGVVVVGAIVVAPNGFVSRGGEPNAIVVVDGEPKRFVVIDDVANGLLAIGALDGVAKGLVFCPTVSLDGPGVAEVDVVAGDANGLLGEENAVGSNTARLGGFTGVVGVSSRVPVGVALVATPVADFLKLEAV